MSVGMSLRRRVQQHFRPLSDANHEVSWSKIYIRQECESEDKVRQKWAVRLGATELYDGPSRGQVRAKRDTI